MVNIWPSVMVSSGGYFGGHWWSGIVNTAMLNTNGQSAVMITLTISCVTIFYSAYCGQL